MSRQPKRHRILLIELSNLGDAVLTYPAIGALWQAYPNGEFHVLAGPRSVPLFEEDARINRVWVWNKEGDALEKLSLLFQLFLQRFTLVIDFRHSLIPLLLGARRSRLLRRPPAASGSHKPKGSGEASDSRSHAPGGVSGAASASRSHRVLQHLQVVADLGFEPPMDGPGLFFGREEEREISQWLIPGKEAVVISPGSRSHLKRWAAQRFAQVADRLVEEEGAQIFLVGSAEEAEIAEKVLSSMRHPATDLTGRTNFRQLGALLSRARLCITNDNAVLHIAQAMNAPTLAIFGPTDEAKYGPRNPNSLVVRKKLVCAPCERALCPYGHECLKWLEVDEVFEAAVKILKKKTYVSTFQAASPVA